MCSDEGLSGTVEAWSPAVLSSTTQGELEGRKGSSHLGSCPVSSRSSRLFTGTISDPDQHPFCRGGSCFREVKSQKKHARFIGSCHRGGTQAKPSCWHILDPKRDLDRQAPSSTGDRWILLEIIVCFHARVQKHKPANRGRGSTGKRGLGPALASHRRPVSAGETGEVTWCTSADRLRLPEVEGGACCGKMLTPGDLGSALESEP